MVRAEYKDRKLITNILANSFADNKSVNYIIRQDSKRIERIKRLMEYSFELCYSFGDVFLSDDKKGCALILFPDKKKSTTWLDIKLIFSVTGLANLKKAIHRELKIKKLQPRELMYYLWFIGVDPLAQNRGTGTALMKEIIKESESIHRPIFLETSTIKNIPWYKKLGFKIYNELDLGYKLFFMNLDKH
jgi:GNAT superfamily N-acetyltransferase